ncbi:MAG: hypothetical protein JW797_06725 [Bradymonadales bacterium]|nr:hypothetical protein [Bradymonadales bacterium]
MKTIRVAFLCAVALSLMLAVSGCGKKEVTEEQLCGKFVQLIPDEAGECHESYQKITSDCADPQATLRCIMDAETMEEFEACERFCVPSQAGQ